MAVETASVASADVRTPVFVWPLAAIFVSIALASARVVIDPRFYFADDTQTGTLGQWYELGSRLLQGALPILNPHAWTAGNYLAEGQWGVFNPLIWLFALGTHVGDNPVVMITVIKIGMLAVFAGGTYALARSFGAAAPWAAVAGVGAPAGGFTMYMDAPSWTSGLLGVALFTWCWWGLRRCIEDARSPLVYLIAVYLLTTSGYVFGVIMLVVVLIEALVRALVARRWRAARSAVLASAYGAFLTIAVFLPGVLTAPYTVRSGEAFDYSAFLNADLSDMAGSSSPLATMSIGSWSGSVTDAPLAYIMWILPALAFVLPVSRATVRRLIPAFVFAGVVLAIVVGPSAVGPIRWPIRFMPYLVVVVVVVVAVLFTQGFARNAIRTRIAVAAGIVIASSYLAVAGAWGQNKRVLVSAAVQLAGIGVIAAIAWWSRVPSARRSGTAAIAAICVTAVVAVPQMVAFPSTPLPRFATPDSTSAMHDVLTEGVGDAIVVGDVYASSEDPRAFSELLIANQWYLAGTSMSSLYTVLPFKAYSEALCQDLRGSTCAGALQTLWSEDPTTGVPLADLMGISTIVAVKSTFKGVLPHLAEGWELRDDGEFSWVLVRTAPVPRAGGTVWESKGTSVSVVAQDDLGLTLRVDALGADPEVILSRLAWPGYTVSGATLADPVRGFLMTLDLSQASVGEEISVAFRPPGFAIEVASGILALVVLIGWPLMFAVLRRRAARV